MPHHRQHDEHDAHTDTAHPDWPATLDDAVGRLVATLSTQNKQIIRESDDVYAFHFTLGMWIRNTFGLWGGNDVLLRFFEARAPSDVARSLPPPHRCLSIPTTPVP